MNGAVDLLFVDTNVLIYNIDFADPLKQEAAHRWLDQLWEAGSARVSWQVINEFYVNATRRIGAPAAMIRRLVETYVEWGVTDFSFPLVSRAWHWVDHAGIGFWDALIVAAAERSGCRWLLSEDFQENRKFGSVQVVNPFRTKPAKIFRG